MIPSMVIAAGSMLMMHGVIILINTRVGENIDGIFVQ